MLTQEQSSISIKKEADDIDDQEEAQIKNIYEVTIEDHEKQQFKKTILKYQSHLSFCRVSDHVEILRSFGNMHQNRDIPTNFACFALFTLKTTNVWTWRSLDTIIECGEDLYNNSVSSMKLTKKYLTVCDINDCIPIGDKVVEVETSSLVSCGLLTPKNLAYWLSSILSQTKFIIVRYLDRWISVFLFGENFFYFNPYGNDINDFKRKNQYACASLLKFCDFEALIDHICKDFEKQKNFYFQIVIIVTKESEPIE